MTKAWCDGAYIAVVLAVVIVVAVYAQFMSHSWSNFLSDSLGVGAMAIGTAAAENATETIFVAVKTRTSEVEDCALMLRSLFATASDSSRITVGVIYYVNVRERTSDGVGIAAYFTDLRAHYDRLCREAHVRSYGGSIRVIERHEDDDEGLEPARHLLLMEAYNSAKWWCEAHPKLRFQPRWDTRAIRILKRHRMVLTAAPSDIFNTERPTYPVVVQGNDEHRFPHVVPKPFETSRVGRPYESPLLCPSFVMMRANVLTELIPPHPRFTFCDHTDTLVRSARLFTFGFRFYTSAHVLVARRRASPVDSDTCVDVVNETVANSADRRAKRAAGVLAALSVLNEDPCQTCNRPRSEHTTDTALNHPFEPHEHALSNRATLLGSRRTLTQFRASCGAWVRETAPTELARAGIAGGRRICADEASLKGVYDITEHYNYA